MDNFLDNSKQELFDGLNQKPFMSGDFGGDSFNNQGSSIFDQGGSGPSLFDNQQPQSEQQGGGSGFKFDSGEPLIDGFVNFFIALFGFFASSAIVLIELPTIIQNKTASQSFKMFRSMILAVIPLILVFGGMTFFGYYNDDPICYTGFTGLVGSLCNICACSVIFAMIKFSCYGADTEKDLEKMIEEDRAEAVANVTQEEIDQVEDLKSQYTESFDDIINSILGDEEETQEEPISQAFTNFTENDLLEDDDEDKPKEIQMPDTTSVATLNTPSLFKMFSALLPFYNKNFAKTVEWTKDNEYSEKWLDLYAIVGNVWADAFGIELSEVSGDKKLTLLKVKDANLFTYVEVSKPKKKVIKAEDIQNIFDNYSTSLLETICDPKQLFKQEENNKVSTRAWLDGDRYKIIFTKPNKNPVLLGDVLLDENAREEIQAKDIPIILGIDDLGKPIIEPFANKSAPLYSGLIGGGAGSGKSWLFISILLQIMAFHLPTEIQCMLIDPKPDTVFNELNLLPHTSKLIQINLNDPDKLAKDSLKLLEDMNKEVARRGDLFAKEKCANLQDYRKKGHTELPYIFVFIDEYIKLRDNIATYGEHLYKQNLEEWQEECVNVGRGQPKPPKPVNEDLVKKWDSMMKVLTTTGRAPGIYVYIISHRFTGNVDIQTRNLTPLKLVLKSSKLLSETMEPDDVKKFTKKLINAGDAAIKVGENDIKSGKTLGVSLDDGETYKILETIAKTYYKIGVELPDMSPLGKDYVKDLKAIQQELYANTKQEGIRSAQFDENTDVEEDDNKVTSNDDLSLDDMNDNDDSDELNDKDNLDEINYNDGLTDSLEDDDDESTNKDIKEKLRKKDIEDDSDSDLDSILSIDDDGTIHTDSDTEDNNTFTDLDEI